VTNASIIGSKKKDYCTLGNYWQIKGLINKENL